MISARMTRTLRLFIVATLVAGSAAVAARPDAGPAAPAAVQATPELLFDQAKRQFDQFQYDAALQLFNQLIAMLTAGGQIQKPDLLVQAYELRARSRFNLGDSLGIEQDFSALLAIKPSHTLKGISPRIIAIFDNVRKTQVGQVALSLTPAGDVEIDGKPYAAQSTPAPVDLLVGDHQVEAKRPGYKSESRRVTVLPGQLVELALTLERVSSTLSVTTVPEGVDVLFDGTSKGVTKKGDGSSDSSAALLLADLPVGSHRLTLRRDCFKDIERTVVIDRPGDLTIETLRLTPATARVKLQNVPAGSALYIDNAPRGEVPPELTVCEGTHVIEVRGGKGRFIDRRDWKTGEQTTLAVDLRSAFPIVSVKASPGAPADQLRIAAERVLAPTKHLLVYAPPQSEVDAAMKDTNVPPDWLTPDPLGTNPATPRVPRDVKREAGMKAATRLQAQGVAGVSAGSDPYTIVVTILAAGSGEPDVLVINTGDSQSQARAVDKFGAPLPPLVKPSIETSVVDVAGTPGAVVVRAAGVGAKAGLAVGDVIVGVGTSPVTSVAELRAKVAAMRPPNTALSLDVKGPTGTARKVTGTVAMVAEAMPLQDHTLVNNRALLELADTVNTVTAPLEKSSARINLALVQMRLSNWDEALNSLKDVGLPDGPGVSGGTVAYLTGICLEALGRREDAKAAFTKAAAATEARLSSEGPLVAPLAQARLRTMR